MVLGVKPEDENPDKKAKFEKLKIEHQKPYILLKRPEEVLREYLADRKPGKTIVKLIKNEDLKSVMSGSCYRIETDNWALIKYTPYSGLLGILPTSGWQSNLSILTDLKNYGFSNIILAEMAARNCINNNGAFSRDQIYLGFDFEGTIEQCITTWDRGIVAGCYIDEPSETYTCAQARYRLQNSIIPLWRNKFGYSSKIVLGDRTHRLVHEFDDLVDVVNQSSYRDYSYFFFGVYDFIYTEADQRDAWNSFNSSFSNKFNCLWISANSDQEELSDLIGHARNIDKNQVWLYDGGDWNTIDNFCYYAWQNHFISRHERKYIYVWSYIGYEDPCYDYQITSWELIDIIETSETRVLN